MFLLKKRYWVLVTLLMVPVLIIWRTPATMAVGLLQQAAPTLALSGISGSVWRGSIASSYWVDRGYELPLGRLQWQLRGLSLLGLTPCARVTATAGAQLIKAKICYSLLSGRVSIADLDAAIPLINISPLLQVDVGGHIDAYIKSAVWDGQRLADVDANLLWNGAEMNNGSEWIPLGDLQANASAGPDGRLLSRWSSVSSGESQPPPVAIQLDLVVTDLTGTKPRIQVTGSIQPGPQTMALQPMLQFIGEPTPSGAYRIAIDD
ncbi:MAG: type II secretion system protein N [Cellvibrionaceae bacterium]|nr:type II secretion system protein N [Cellvibrionaceae bacterium]